MELMLSLVTPCRPGIFHVSSQLLLIPRTKERGGGDRGTYLHGLHGTAFENLLDDLVVVVGAELRVQHVLGRRVVRALGALSTKQPVSRRLLDARGS